MTSHWADTHTSAYRKMYAINFCPWHALVKKIISSGPHSLFYVSPYPWEEMTDQQENLNLCGKQKTCSHLAWKSKSGCWGTWYTHQPEGCTVKRHMPMFANCYPKKCQFYPWSVWNLDNCVEFSEAHIKILKAAEIVWNAPAPSRADKKVTSRSAPFATQRINKYLNTQIQNEKMKKYINTKICKYTGTILSW